MFNRPRLGELLVDHGLASQEAVDAALASQRTKSARLGDLLVDLHGVDPFAITQALGMQFEMPCLERLRLDEVDLDLLDAVPIAYARSRKILPLRQSGDVVQVAMADPLDLAALDQVGNALHASTEPVLVPGPALLEAVNMAYDKHDRRRGSYGDMLGSDESRSTTEVVEPGFEDVVDLLGAGGDDEAPVIQFVNTTFVRAARDRASDIHIEPYEGRVVVRFRVDGVLQQVAEVPKRFHASIAARVKIMAGLNIAEKRLPQDGRIRIKLAGKDIDIRVATAPTTHGERVTMRLLDRSSVMLDLAAIGMDAEILYKVHDLIAKPYGIILVTGPTGSGKTTTLYSCLAKINTPDKNILTVEDPVEYQLQGISQVAVNPKIDLTFASGLRSFLRHDPDVIMVGEIRDQETAEIAIQASLTGHLVFSTIHTNDAAGAFTRLIDMGVEPFLVASSLLANMAQRLVRRLCEHCKQPYTPTEEDVLQLEVTTAFVASRGNTFHRPGGCDQCKQSGYRGRLGIYELLTVSQEVKQLVMRRTDAGAIKRQAVLEGMRTLRQDGADKVTRGLTSVEEILRVTQKEVA